MLFGLSLDLLNFSSSVVYQRKKINILEDPNALDLLTSLLRRSLKKKCQFEVIPPITIHNIGPILAILLCNVTPSEYHALCKCFWTHFLMFEGTDPEYEFPFLIKIDKRIFMTPLYQNFLSYAPEIMSTITAQDSVFLFEKLELYPSMTLAEQLQFSWLHRLSTFVIKKDNEKCLLLAELPETMIQGLYNIYTLFLAEFKTFPFTTEEQEEKQKIQNYLIALRDFLNVHNK